MFRLLGIGAIVLFGFSNGQASAEILEIHINEENCRRVEKHVARNDVTYKPGVDVHGKPVVPADLDGHRVVFPETITIDLSLPLQDLYKNPNPKLKNADVQIGKLDYNMLSGTLKFNGQELGDPALNAIAIECRNIYSNNGS